MPALQTLLNPQVLTRTVSQVAASSDWLAALFGVQPGGKNIINQGHGREGAFHVYNNTRKVARGRTPGSAAARRAAQPMGKVMFSYPRMHDSVSLVAEQLHNLSKIDDPAVRDVAGKDMVSRQTTTLGQLAANWRKVQLMGMLRDSLYVARNGDDEYFSLTDPGITGERVNFRMPSGNQGQLNMLGAGNIITGSFASDSTDIPLIFGNINAAFQQLCGGFLGAVITNWQQWNNIIGNAFVQALHGTSSAPFVSVDWMGEETVAKTMKNVYMARLNFMPQTTFYITDEGLEIGLPGSETYQKIIPANNAAFIGFTPGDDVVGMYEGSEPIAEYDGGPMNVKTGLSSWSVARSNPTATELYVLDNAMVANHVPAAMAFGTVQF
jgi:hypothetical protein